MRNKGNSLREVLVMDHWPMMLKAVGDSMEESLRDHIWSSMGNTGGWLSRLEENVTHEE